MSFRFLRDRRVAAVLAITVLPTLGVSGCAADHAAGDGRPTALASFYPLEFVARQVGGTDLAVDNLTKPGVEPHDLELNPRQVAAIAEADLVLYLRGLQPAVDEAVEQNNRRPPWTPPRWCR